MAKKSTSNKQFTTNQRRINTEWLRNASRSLGMNGLNVIQDLAPNISDVTSVATDSVKKLNDNIKEISKGDTKISDLIERNKYVKLAKTGLQNAMDDLKSGNFNNEQRELEAFSGGNDEADSGMFFDDSDENSEGSKNVIINQGASNASMAVVNKSINKQTEMQLKGVQATVDTMVAVTSASMVHQQGLTASLLTGLDNINNNLAALVSFQNNTMGKFIESASAYMEKMGSAHASEEAITEKKKRIKADDIFDPKGNIDANKYKELVKNQFNDWFSETAPGMVKDILDNFGDQLVANPLKTISTVVMQEVIPKTIKESIASVDTAFSGFFPAILERLSTEFGNSGRRGVTGDFMRMIGNVFGIRRDRKNEFDMSNKITEAATQFSKMDHFAISEMIPKYLRESNAYLKSIAEALDVDTRKAVLDADVFDYTDGKYVKQINIQKKILNELTGSVIDSFRSSLFGKELVNMGTESNVFDDKEKESYNKMLDQFFVQLEKFGNPNIIDGDTTGLDKILENVTGDDKLKYFLRESVLSTVNDRRYGLNMSNTIMKANNDRRNAVKNIENNALAYNAYGLFNEDTVLDDQMKLYAQGFFDNIKNSSAKVSTPGGLSVTFGNGNKSEESEPTADIFGAKPISGLDKNIQDKIKDSIKVMHPEIDPEKLSYTEKIADSLQREMYKYAYGRWDRQSVEESLGKENVARLEEFKNKVFAEDSNNPVSYLGKKLSDVVKKLNFEMTGEGYTDSNGKEVKAQNLNGKKVSLVEALKKTTSDVFKDLKVAIFGEKNAEGKKEGGLPFVQFARKTFNDGISGYADALFGKDTSGKPMKERIGSFISDKLKSVKELVPEELRDSLNKNGDAALKGGLVGTIIGGPIIGGLTGSAIGLFSRSKTFQEFLYGKEDETGKKNGGLFKIVSEAWGKKKDTDGLEFDSKKFSMAAVGTGAGLLASFFTPLGPIGGAALGLASSMIASNDKFKKFLFGGEDEKEPSLMKRFSNVFNSYVLRPMKDKGATLMEEAKGFIKESFLDPILFAVEPITIFMKRKFDDITSGIAKKMNDAFDFVKENIKNIVVSSSSFIFKTIGNFLSPVTSMFTGIAKGVIGAPAKVLSGIGNFADKRNRMASVKRVREENEAESGIYNDLITKYDAAVKARDNGEEYNQEDIDAVETRYYNSNFRNENKATSDEEKKRNKQKRKEDKQSRKDKTSNIQFITRMTDGALTDDTEENRKIAMDIFNKKLAENKRSFLKSDKVGGYRKFEFKGDADKVDYGEDATQATGSTITEETASATKEATEKTAENTADMLEEIKGLKETVDKLLEKREKIQEEAKKIREDNIANGRNEFDYSDEFKDKAKKVQEELDAKQQELETKEEEYDNAMAEQNQNAFERFLSGTKNKVKGGVNAALDTTVLQKIFKLPRNAPHYAVNIAKGLFSGGKWIGNKGIGLAKTIGNGYKSFDKWFSNLNFDDIGKKKEEGGEGGYGSPFTPAGHYVVASGLDDKGNVMINNPNERSGSQKYNLSSVLNQTGRAWGLNGGRGIISSDNKDDRLHVVVDEINSKSNPIRTIISGTKGILPIFSFGTRRSTTNSKASIDSATQSESNLSVEDLAADFKENDIMESSEKKEKTDIFSKIKDLLGGLGGFGNVITNAITQGSNVISSLGNMLTGGGGLIGGIVKGTKALGIGATVAGAAGLAYDYFKNNKDTNKNTFLTNEDGSLMLDENGNPIQMTEQNKPDQSRSTFIERMKNYLTPNKTRVNTDKDSEDYGKWSTNHTNDALSGERASALAGFTLKTAGTLVEKFLPLAKEAIEVLTLKLAGLLEKHGFKFSDKVLDLGGNIASKITKKAAEKHTSKIAAVFAKIGVSGGTLALADAAFIAVGALSGLTSAGELFEVNLDDENIDGYIKRRMMLISTVFKGFMNTSVGSIIDVVDILVTEASGFSPIKWLAQNVLKLWLDDVDEEKVSQAQENMKSDYNSFVEQEYEAYLAGLSDQSQAMSLEEFSKSNLSTSFNDYNADQNKSMFDKAGESIGKAVKGVKESFSVTTNRDNSSNVNTGASTMKTSSYTTGPTSPVNTTPNIPGAMAGGFGDKINGSTFYSQKDPRWKNAGYGNSGDTMGNAGCGPTAMAMALSDATGSKINPMQMASMAQRGGYRDETGTNASFVSDVSNAFGVSTTEAVNPNEAFIRNELSLGNPVVLLGKSGGFGGDGNDPFTSAGHFNYATGIDKDGNVMINDPRGKTYSRKYKLNKVAKQAGRAWAIQSGRGPTESKQEKLTASAEETRKAVVDYMKSLEGKLYYAGGSNTSKRDKIDQGWADCSSLIWYIYKNVANINIPNTSKGMINSTTGKVVDNNSGCPNESNLKPGDVILFDGHAEMYIGNGQMMGHGGGKNGDKMGPTVHNIKNYCDYVKDYVCTRRWIMDGQDFELTSLSVPNITAVSNNSEVGDSGVTKKGSVLSNIFDIGNTLGSFFKSAASKAMRGILTGEWDTDYSDVFGSSNPMYSEAGANSNDSYSTGGVNSSNVTAAKNWKSSETEPEIYKFFTNKNYTKAGAAGLVGNLYHESGLRPNNVQDSCQSRVGDDATYTANVDAGPHDFVNDKAGYGLAQWTSSGRKEGLLNYVRSKGTSISDLNSQLEYLDKELTESYSGVKKVLTTTNDVVEASNIVLHKFESPKDQSAAVENTRASSSMAIYEKYQNDSSDKKNTITVSKKGTVYGDRKNSTLFSGYGDGPTNSPEVDYQYKEKQSPMNINNYKRTTNIGNYSRIPSNNNPSGITDEEMKMLIKIANLLESIAGNTGDTSNKLEYLKTLKSGTGSNIILSGGNSYQSNNNYGDNSSPTTNYDKQRMTALKIAKG